MAPTTKKPEPVEETGPDETTAPAIDPELLEAMRTWVPTEDGGASLLAWKTSAVMGEVYRIRKSGRNQAQGYDFAREGDIADMIRELLARYRVGFHGSLISVQREEIVSSNNNRGTLAIVRMQFTLVCADTGEVEETYWEGDATDYTDKAVPKAITACKKSWLIFRFLVSTGDLEEADAGGQEFQRAASVRPQPVSSGPDTRKVTQAQIGRIYGMAREVPFLLDQTEGGGSVNKDAVHVFCRWVLHRNDPPPAVESLKDLTRVEVDVIFTWLERAKQDPGRVAAMMDEWLHPAGEDPDQEPVEESDIPEGY